MNRTIEKTRQEKQDRWFPVFCTVCILLLLINSFVVRTAVVDGRSMCPTLEDGDLLIVWQLGYEPAAGDIVVIDTSDSLLERENIVKRVIATQGQSVSIDYDQNMVRVEGQVIREPYINYDQEDPMLPTDEKNVAGYTVPEGCVFVMGDNRNHSSDSRSVSYGMIPEGDIMGKVVSVF